jgi:hypothetical protein
MISYLQTDKFTTSFLKIRAVPKHVLLLLFIFICQNWLTSAPFLGNDIQNYQQTRKYFCLFP